MVPIDTARVDAWLWAVRIFKTRSAATAACRGGHVRVNRAPAKSSTPVKVGDRVEAFVERQRILEVAVVIDKRVGAVVAEASGLELGLKTGHTKPRFRNLLCRATRGQYRGVSPARVRLGAQVLPVNIPWFW